MKKYISPAYDMEKLETIDVVCVSGISVGEEVDPITGEVKTVATVSFSSLFGNSAN